MATINKMSVEERAEQCDSLPAEVAAPCPWYALYTRSHCEQLVYEQLTAKGFDLFLPQIQVWSQRAGVRHRIEVPMFPGYLFLQSLVDSATYLEVRQARGLVRILGQGWDRLAVVPAEEIHWSRPCGKPLSNQASTGNALPRKCHDPSACCEPSRNFTPWRKAGDVG